MKEIGIVEFKYLKEADEMHYRIIKGDYHPSAAQTTAAKKIMKTRGIGKTRFKLYDNGKSIKEI